MTTIPLAARLMMGGLVCSTGVLFGTVGYEPFVNGIKSKNWKQVTGVVVEPAGESYELLDPSRLLLPVVEFKIEEHVKETPEQVKPTIVYRTLTNKTYSYELFGLNRNDIGQLHITEHIRPGTHVTVRYDESNPTNNVIVPGYNIASGGVMMLSLTGILSGIIIAMSKEEILAWNNFKKFKIRSGILSASLVAVGICAYLPSVVKKQILSHTDEEIKKKWIDPYIVSSPSSKN